MIQIAPKHTTINESRVGWLRSRATGVRHSGTILLHAPSFAFQSPGGGENQLVQTGRHLEDLGHRVCLFNPWTDALERSRVLHLFGMSVEGLELARRAKAVGTPVVLSPIYWSEPAAIWNLEPTLTRKLRGLTAYAARRVLNRLGGWRRELLMLSDRILPNSAAEARMLTQIFRVDPERISVVPNGVLEQFRHASPVLFRERFGDRDFVLFVGRIEPRKNPLGLIRATRELGLPLVIVGDPPAMSQDYYEKCQAMGGSRVTWLAAWDHDHPLLASAYAAARVFALPSWFETPSLSALEAAIAGTSVVITPYGSAREYFGDRVEYARPNRETEIAAAVAKSWSQRSNPDLAAFVASNYLWADVAKRTAEVYDQVAR